VNRIEPGSPSPIDIERHGVADVTNRLHRQAEGRDGRLEDFWTGLCDAGNGTVDYHGDVRTPARSDLSELEIA
jgi:hypothetical protein